MALFTIKGVKEIRDAYKLLPKRVANKVVRQGIRKGLRPMKSAVERNAPGPKTVKTGATGKRDSRGRFVSISRTRNTGRTARSVKIRARKNRKRGQIALD